MKKMFSAIIALIALAVMCLPVNAAKAAKADIPNISAVYGGVPRLEWTHNSAYAGYRLDAFSADGDELVIYIPRSKLQMHKGKCTIGYTGFLKKKLNPDMLYTVQLRGYRDMEEEDLDITMPLSSTEFFALDRQYKGIESAEFSAHTANKKGQWRLSGEISVPVGTAVELEFGGDIHKVLKSRDGEFSVNFNNMKGKRKKLTVKAYAIVGKKRLLVDNFSLKVTPPAHGVKWYEPRH